MERLLEMELVRQCAPTLAGLKAASLFRFVFPPLVSPFALISRIAIRLAKRNLFLEMLSFDMVKRSGLLFVYRPCHLDRIMKEDGVPEFFSSLGYTGSHWQDHLAEISLRLAKRASFPHEIGVLLDYPLDDVKAYMASPKEKGLCSGCWKAYTNPARARHFFEKCQKCTRVYCECYAQGSPLERLLVA